MTQEKKELEITAESIWKEYQNGVSYNNGLELYDKIKKNENFYSGNQWEGVNAPDLPKPVINVLKRVVSYFISMIVSDNVTANFTPFFDSDEMEMQSKVLKDGVANVIEQNSMTDLSREIIRDAAVNGDACLYLYFDPEAESGQDAKGCIKAELIDNSCVMFGNPYSSDTQSQQYIIISMRKTLQNAKEEARQLGVPEDQIDNIKADDDNNLYNPSDTRSDNLVTVLVKMYRQNGTIWAVKSTKDMILRKPWDLQYTLYPVSMMRWEKMRNSYHGISAINAMIPNQIAINQLFAMAIHHVKSMAFPKVIYDASKIPNWSNKVGQAIGTMGNPNDAIATGFRAPDMSAQVLELIDRLIQKTLEFMGASDATLGNVKPDNTSAIIAIQKSSAMPLELQRMEFYRFTEEYVREIVEIMRVDYGTRLVAFDVDGAEEIRSFNFGDINPATMNMHVDIGSSAYWSELMQIQTLDNLFTKGIITDAETYLEGIPDGYIPNKGKILEQLRERQMSLDATQAQQIDPMMRPEQPMI